MGIYRACSSVKVELIYFTAYSSDEGRREQLSDSSDDQQLQQFATPAEKYLHGLLLGRRHSQNNVSIAEVEGRGRSAFANKDFEPGDFVCEYASTVRVKSIPDNEEERNEQLGIGCYCLDATYNDTIYTFDASHKINDPGRYINHASKNANLLKMKPAMVESPSMKRLRIGFVAKSSIKCGDELFYDYGIRDPEILWLSTDAKKVSTTIKEVGQQSSKLPTKRTRNDCPYPDCSSTQLSKLGDHLKRVHAIEDAAERKIWLQIAKEVNMILYVGIAILCMPSYVASYS